jgi:predicted metal-binding membrane protein
MEAAPAVTGARLPAAVPVAIAGAWGITLLAQVSGRASLLHHDSLVGAQLPLPAAVVVFLVAWQVMVAAMMLPSALPLVRLFAVTSAGQPRRRVVMAAFLSGYGAVWAGFGAVAFLADVGFHRLVEQWDWLQDRPWLVLGTVLVGAGAFQFSDLKDRCLDQCRHPGAYLLPRYRRGAAAAFRLGSGHGLFCLGCCFALMMVMFAVGMGSLVWMGALAALMIHEKTGPGGKRSVPLAGWSLLVGGVLMLLQPPWLPQVISR